MRIQWVFVISVIISLTSSPVMAVETDAASKPRKPLSIEDNIYVKKRRMPITELYKKVLLAFEHNGYFVTFEPNIGKSMEPFAERWGKDYNRNKIDDIRSMVLSNPWFANKIANADPYLLAMFPLTVTLIQKGNYTVILFVRPSKVASLSRRGKTAAEEMEKDVIRIFENIL